MTSTVLLRSRSARALGATMIGLSVFMLGSALVGGVAALLDFAAPTVLFGVLGWAAFWRPYVEVTDGGVTVANTLRTLEVPWPAIESVDGRYGLRMQTAYGRVTAWAAPAPKGRERAREQQSVAALAVTGRLEELRVAGHLDDPRLERPAPVTVWNRQLLVAIGVLVLASVILPLIG
ncbi:MAG: PH domain-containing protein [Marmoricola sp.]